MASVDGKILDGRAVAAKVKEELKKSGHHPCLAAVLVGDNPASHLYVRNKIRGCQEVGITSRFLHLQANTSQDTLEQTIATLNGDPAVHGILLQLPLPKGLDTSSAAEKISPEKDVDGITRYSAGQLTEDTEEGFVPCTPLGIQVLLEHYGISPEGRHVVIAGRSNIVGKPMAMLLLRKGANANATVTVVHSKTKELFSYTKEADILIAAVGRAQFFGKEAVKPGAIVIDVGQNHLNNRLVGDVHYEEVLPIVSAITPVPGGVGPMTIAMLLANTMKAYRQCANC